MALETLTDPENQRREDLARRYGKVPGEKLNRITHVARVCLAIELDEELRHGNEGPPSQISERIAKVSGLTEDEVRKAITNSTNSADDAETYIAREKDEEGYKLVVTEAGRGLVDRQVLLVAASSG